MAKSIKSVGIKELKDQASSVIDEVERRRSVFSVTRNNREVARIVPVTEDPFQRLKESGRVASLPKQSWESFELDKPKGRRSASAAIRAISKDRDEG
jgi:prevent-host-death family protein